jgi:hypothetical protein
MYFPIFYKDWLFIVSAACIGSLKQIDYFLVWYFVDFSCLLLGYWESLVCCIGAKWVYMTI